MKKINITVGKLNIDMVLAATAGFLAGLMLKGRFDSVLYMFMLSFSPAVPDIFMPGFYPELICGAVGGCAGLCIYAAWNRKGSRIIKKALIIAAICIAAFNAMFFLHTNYISYQLRKPIEQISGKSRFYPADVRISSKDSLMAGNESRSTGNGRELKLNEGSPYIKAVYDGVQGMKNEGVHEKSFESDFSIGIDYKNNKNYTGRFVWLGEKYASERLTGIGDIQYDAGTLHDTVEKIMNECRKFDKADKEYFSAQWYDAKLVAEGAGFKSIENAGPLFDAMSVSQNYSPTYEEKNFYGKFFDKQPITAKDGDLAAVFYSFDTEMYTYGDVALYDRTKTLLIFKDENNRMKYVNRDLNGLFR